MCLGHRDGWFCSPFGWLGRPQVWFSVVVDRLLLLLGLSTAGALLQSFLVPCRRGSDGFFLSFSLRFVCFLDLDGLPEPGGQILFRYERRGVKSIEITS